MKFILPLILISITSCAQKAVFKDTSYFKITADTMYGRGGAKTGFGGTIKGRALLIKQIQWSCHERTIIKWPPMKPNSLDSTIFRFNNEGGCSGTYNDPFVIIKIGDSNTFTERYYKFEFTPITKEQFYTRPKSPIL